MTRKVPPQLADAATVNVDAAAVAVPDGEVGFKTTQVGSFATVVSTVNGVPPGAWDVTETV